VNSLWRMWRLVFESAVTSVRFLLFLEEGEKKKLKKKKKKTKKKHQNNNKNEALLPKPKTYIF
jgi:hypothetical protein